MVHGKAMLNFMSQLENCFDPLPGRRCNFLGGGVLELRGGPSDEDPIPEVVMSYKGKSSGAPKQKLIVRREGLYLRTFFQKLPCAACSSCLLALSVRSLYIQTV